VVAAAFRSAWLRCHLQRAEHQVGLHMTGLFTSNDAAIEDVSMMATVVYIRLLQPSADGLTKRLELLGLIIVIATVSG